jgi:hypothetical protein
MKKKYYLLEVEGGVEPIVRGPYRAKIERDSAAKRIRLSQEEDDGLFWLDINEVGVPTIGVYTAGFFWENST